MDWDINTRRTQLQSNDLGCSDWNVDTSRTTCLHQTTLPGRIGTSTQTRPLHWATEADQSLAAAANKPTSPQVAAVGYGPRAERKTRETDRTAPHRRGHRHAGPTAVVPLQHHTPSDRVKPPDPDHTGCLAVATAKHNARGPRCIRRWIPPHSSPRLTRGPCHARLSTPSRRSVY